MVCGAAAGVAAIFKAPATGMVFALEVPYRQDLARRMLLPAMFSAAVELRGVRRHQRHLVRLFPIGGAPPFDFRDLAGAALLGLLCGGAARLFARGRSYAAKAAVGRYNPMFACSSPRCARCGLRRLSWAHGTIARDRLRVQRPSPGRSSPATPSAAIVGRLRRPMALATTTAARRWRRRQACSSPSSSRARLLGQRDRHRCSASRIRRCFPCSGSPRSSAPATGCRWQR